MGASRQQAAAEADHREYPWSRPGTPVPPKGRERGEFSAPAALPAEQATGRFGGIGVIGVGMLSHHRQIRNCKDRSTTKKTFPAAASLKQIIRIIAEVQRNRSSSNTPTYRDSI